MVLVFWLGAIGCNAGDDPADGPMEEGGGFEPGGTGSPAGSGGKGGSSGKGGSGGSGPQAGSSGTGGSECSLATKPGAKVVVDCATKVTAKDAGTGFRPAAPMGSECDGERTFTLALESGELEWSKCIATGTTPWKLDEGMRTLGAGELEAVMTALHMITVWDGMMLCGADKYTLTIDVTTPNGAQSYEDSFYSCNMKPGVIYVDNIDDSFGKLDELAEN